MAETGFPKLHFATDFDECRAYLVRSRGYLGDVVIELSDGSRHAVYFYDPVRLAQDLELGMQDGMPCVAEKGMIVVNEITLETMTAAIRFLAEEGFFTSGLKTDSAG